MTVSKLHLIGGCLLLGIMTAVAGLSEKPPQKYEVTGLVLVNGVPMGHGEIRFIPVDGRGTVGAGKIMNGRFRFPSEAGRKQVEIRFPSLRKSRRSQPLQVSSHVDHDRGEIRSAGLPESIPVEFAEDKAKTVPSETILRQLLKREGVPASTDASYVSDEGMNAWRPYFHFLALEELSMNGDHKTVRESVVAEGGANHFRYELEIDLPPEADDATASSGASGREVSGGETVD